MPRPLTPRQAHQNEIFLDSLARSGNVRLSARAAGVAYGTIQHRRSAHVGFAHRWEAAVVAVHARLHLAGGKRGPETAARRTRGGAGRKKMDPGLRRDDGRGFRTRGGEPMVVRTRSGRLQVRLAHPGKLTRAAEQVFLCALAATANVRLSAAAAGASARAFHRRRKRDAAFGREFRIALRIGYDRLEQAAMERTLEALQDRPPAWLARSLAANPIPPLSFDQAFQQLCLHRNNVRLDQERPPGGRPRIEPGLPAALAAIGRNIDAIERSAHFEATGQWRLADEAPPPPLPPLHLVTGWSKADPAKPRHNPRLALFGGWRIEEMERKRRGNGPGRARAAPAPSLSPRGTPYRLHHPIVAASVP